MQYNTGFLFFNTDLKIEKNSKILKKQQCRLIIKFKILNKLKIKINFANQIVYLNFL
jgi:hypothetical protein